jgi:rubrerythrin
MDAETFDRIMQQSIAAEIAARDFYRQAAERIADPAARDVFLSLSADEEKHREILETFRFNPEARVTFEKVTDYQVAEGEQVPDLSFDMSPAEALQVAIKKEQAAMELYQSFADQCDDVEIRKLYSELAAMERGHKVRIENLFVDTAYPEKW